MKNVARSVLMDGGVFVSILKLAGTARRLQQNIQLKETILEYGSGLLVHPISSHLHRASHDNTRSNDYRYDCGVGIFLPGSDMIAATRPGTALYCTRSFKRFYNQEEITRKT